MDGTRDAEYGSALAVQTVETQFGDNNSELNAAYGLFNSGKLFLMITGNIEDNFNSIEIFIDSKAGGQSVFDSSGNANAQNMDGLVFDAGFTADYHLFVQRGDVGNPTFNLHFADLGAQSASGYFDILGGMEGSGITGTGVNSAAISVGYDNSNVQGVLGGINAANAAAAAAVTTGLELAIDLADLVNPGDNVRVMVGVNNGDHNYWSNQFLGGLAAPHINLGGDGAGGFTGEGAIDFTTLAGNQYFELTAGREVPEASTWAAVGALALVTGAAWLKRRAGT